MIMFVQYANKSIRCERQRSMNWWKYFSSRIIMCVPIHYSIGIRSINCTHSPRTHAEIYVYLWFITREHHEAMRILVVDQMVLCQRSLAYFCVCVQPTTPMTFIMKYSLTVYICFIRYTGNYDILTISIVHPCPFTQCSMQTNCVVHYIL